MTAILNNRVEVEEAALVAKGKAQWILAPLRTLNGHWFSRSVAEFSSCQSIVLMVQWTQLRNLSGLPNK